MRAAAHDLRSPLAALTARVDATLARDREAGRYRAELREIGTDIARLATLADHLLLLARDASAMTRESVPLRDLAADAVDRARELDPEADVDLVAPQAVTVAGDRVLLGQAIWNLTVNAVRHAPGATVTVTVGDGSGGATVEVRDDGPGVPPDVLARLGEPFYRPDASRSAAGGQSGHGLGLALVRRAAGLHGGSLTLESAPGKGFTATLRLPASPPRCPRQGARVPRNGCYAHGHEFPSRRARRHFPGHRPLSAAGPALERRGPWRRRPRRPLRVGPRGPGQGAHPGGGRADGPARAARPAGSGRVSRVAYVGPTTPELDPWIDERVTDHGTLLSNLEAGVEALAGMGLSPGERVLVATADIPLLTSEQLAQVLAAAPEGAALVYPVVRREDCERAFPGMRRTYARLRDGTFTGGNVFLLDPRLIGQFLPRLREVLAARKAPFKLARLIGPGVLVRLLLGRLTVRELEARVSAILGVPARALITPHAAIGNDVDQEADLGLAEAHLRAVQDGSRPAPPPQS